MFSFKQKNIYNEEFIINDHWSTKKMLQPISLIQYSTTPRNNTPRQAR